MAVFFNETNYLNVGTGVNTTGDEITVTAWARLADELQPSDARLISKGVSQAAQNYALRISANGERPQFSVDVDGGNSRITSLVGAPNLIPGEWNFIAGTWSSTGIIRIWTNAVIGNERQLSAGTIDTGTEEVWIGDQPTTQNRPMNGDLEDVRVYDRALQQIEMDTLLATRGADGIVEGLIARWPLQDFAPGVIAGSVTDIIGRNSGVGVASPVFSEGTTKIHRRTHHPFAVPGL